MGKNFVHSLACSFMHLVFFFFFFSRSNTLCQALSSALGHSGDSRDSEPQNGTWSPPHRCGPHGRLGRGRVNRDLRHLQVWGSLAGPGAPPWKGLLGVGASADEGGSCPGPEGQGEGKKGQMKRLLQGASRPGHEAPSPWQKPTRWRRFPIFVGGHENLGHGFESLRCVGPFCQYFHINFIPSAGRRDYHVCPFYR